MAVRTNFEYVQSVLGNHSTQGKQTKNKIIQMAGFTQVAAGAFAVLSAVIAISSVAHPILGAFGLMFGAASLVASYEGFIIARNVQEVVRGSMDGFSTLITRLMNGNSPEAFVVSILKDTLVVDALLREHIIAKFNERVVV
jgi:hypothetical protein